MSRRSMQRNSRGDQRSHAVICRSMDNRLALPGRVVIPFALLLLFLTGCGSYESQVTGMVTLDGTAVDKGTVTFYPSGGGAAAYAQVNAEGVYRVQTGGESGLQAGKYNVAVRIVDQIPAKTEWDPPGFRSIIPKRYKNPQTSGLECDVTPGRNEFNIDLSSKEKP